MLVAELRQAVVPAHLSAAFGALMVRFQTTLALQRRVAHQVDFVGSHRRRERLVVD